MKTEQFEEQKRTRMMVMAALIVVPFLLAALLWWVLPSGYSACMANKAKVSGITDFWDPLRPAIKLGTGIFKP